LLAAYKSVPTTKTSGNGAQNCRQILEAAPVAQWRLAPAVF